MRRFLAVFLILQLFLFAAAEHLAVKQFFIAPLTAGVVQICSWLVTHADQQAEAMANLLWSPANNVGVSIESGCDGVAASVTLIAAIVAFPASWFDRAWGIVAGFVAVQALNIVRIISLFYLIQWNRSVFDFAHNYVWQGLIMLDVLVFWLLWVRRSQKTSSVPAAA